MLQGAEFYSVWAGASTVTPSPVASAFAASTSAFISAGFSSKASTEEFNVSSGIKYIYILKGI